MVKRLSRCERLAQSCKRRSRCTSTAHMDLTCFGYCIQKTEDCFLKNQQPFFTAKDACGLYPGNGKVIGEFTCDRIYELAPLNHAPDDVEKQACLTREEIVNYLKGTGYGWHISDFKLYDKPLPLNTFKKWFRECAYSDLGFAIPDCEKCTDSGCFVQKPPQSWFFVEELK